LTLAGFVLARLAQKFKDIQPVGELKELKQKAAFDF
jgi:hypothetical protein